MGYIGEKSLKPLVKEILKMQNPIGHIRMETTDVNPATYLGFGTWVLWGAGRVPVGVNTAETEFNEVEKIGGAKEITLSEKQMPRHSHSYSKAPSETNKTTLSVDQIPSHKHDVVTWGYYDSGGASGEKIAKTIDTADGNGTAETKWTGGGEGHSHGISTTSANTGEKGSGNPHSNIQPYITCFMWKRTA